MRNFENFYRKFEVLRRFVKIMRNFEKMFCKFCGKYFVVVTKKPPMCQIMRFSLYCEVWDMTPCQFLSQLQGATEPG